MATRAKRIVNLSNQYRFDFEAPVVSAYLPDSKPGKDRNALSGSIDLMAYLAPNPDGCYLVQVSGESMIDEGIFDSDILVVDGNESPKEGKVVIASLNGELAVKTYREIDGVVYLFSANKKYNPLKIEPFFEFSIQGVVKHIIHILD